MMAQLSFSERMRELIAGLSISLSGRFQMQGRQALNGLILWQSLVNAQGGIPVGATDKRRVRLIWYDDYSQAYRARDNVSRLLRDDKVDILFGPYSSGLTLAAAEIAEEFRKVLWNYGGSSDEIHRHGRRYVVGIASPASDYLERFPHGCRRARPEHIGFVFSIQRKGPLDGRSLVGFSNPRDQWVRPSNLFQLLLRSKTAIPCFPFSTMSGL